MKSTNTLVLNPTENFVMNIKDDFELLEGLYISDDLRDKNDKIIFGGRNEYSQKLKFMKKDWCERLGATDIDFRFLSGLHAHIITFMSIGNIGDTVLLLPETAGGHYSTEAILKRLGYNVVCAIPDNKNYCVDISQTIDLINKFHPKFAFIDRSEGLYYEDFSWVKNTGIPYCIFDASQYLSQIITGLYKSPFSCGFDLLLSSTHKNYPGPQKAFLATKNDNEYWNRLKFGSNTYISNSHPKEMFRVISTITNFDKLKEYSRLMLEASNYLEQALYKEGFPIIQKSKNNIPTQHIWATFKSKEKTYKVYTELEKIGLLTNYRLLPYDLGYGLRIGIGGAIQQGLRLEHISDLAIICSRCYKYGYSYSLYAATQELMHAIFQKGKLI